MCTRKHEALPRFQFIIFINFNKHIFIKPVRDIAQSFLPHWKCKSKANIYQRMISDLSLIVHVNTVLSTRNLSGVSYFNVIKPSTLPFPWYIIFFKFLAMWTRGEMDVFPGQSVSTSIIRLPAVFLPHASSEAEGRRQLDWRKQACLALVLCFGTMFSQKEGLGQAFRLKWEASQV